MPNTIPQEISNAYFRSHHISFQPIQGGLTNKSYLVTDSNTKQYLLQQLHQLFNPVTIEDFLVISLYLTKKGWKIQKQIPTIDGQYYQFDHQGKIWRLATYIKADEYLETKWSEITYIKIGALLADLHVDLGELTYIPRYQIPHFHDTRYYVQRLILLKAKLPTTALQNFANQLLTTYDLLPPFPKIKKQLIHGDPRTNNILFRNTKPFTYIDFDTIMHGSRWIDIGDLLRSISGDISQTSLQFSLRNIRAITQGYYNNSKVSKTYDSFTKTAIIAMQHIAIELSIRFITDIVDDSYFAWDNKRFNSRAHNNQVRAETQWEIYQESLRV